MTVFDLIIIGAGTTVFALLMAWLMYFSLGKKDR